MNENRTVDGRRVARVETTVRQTMSQLLLSEYRSYLRGIVTVSYVKMTADLKSARVYISVLGADGDAEETMDGLQEVALDIQGRLGRTLGLRYTPKVTFVLDRSGEEAEKVSRILGTIPESDRYKPEPSEDASQDDDE